MFKALADPTRRSLLDELFREDGQTLGMLEERFDMTRFGVMKHLKQLEEAGLVVTRRRGREKLHFLNPVPIRLIHDRWVSKYSEPWVAGLSEIKDRLERQMEKVYEIFIKTTPERLWEAIVDPETRAKYNFGAAVNSDWKVGAPISVDVAKHDVHLGEGEVLEIDPPRRLVHTMAALWDDEVRAEGFSRPRRLVTTRPASSSCLRCFMTPKRVMSKRSSSMPRVCPSSRKSSSSKLLRVGSASALNTSSNSSTPVLYVTI